MKRKFVALLAALALLTGPVLAAETPEWEENAQAETQVDTEVDAEVETEAETPITYVDVPEDEWFFQVVYEMTEKGLMSGIGDGYFGPNDGVNRAMVVTVLWRMEGCPQPEDPASFTDIDPENPDFWYAPQAAWAKEVGIANGYEDGTFHGEDLVTREQMASFLYQYAKYTGQPLAQGSLGLFDDAYLVSEWAVDAVKHVVGMGIIQGDAWGNLDPQGPTTRAALATMLHRMMIDAAG